MTMANRSAAAVLAGALLLSGCASNGNPSGAGIGAVLGGIAGAGIGRAIGHNSGSKVHGAWAGAGIGAVIGGLTGALVDENKRAPRHSTSPVDLDLAPMEPARPAPVVRETRVVYGEDLPPIPPPRPTRTVTTTTTTRTTTTVRRTVPGTVVERVVIVE
jgi:hypothetical protein